MLSVLMVLLGWNVLGTHRFTRESEGRTTQVDPGAVIVERLEVRGEPMLKSFRTKELQYFQMQIHVFQVGFARPCVPCVRSIVTSSNPIL